MSEANAIDLATHAMILAAELAAPVLLASLVVGLVISLFQSVTQLQEVTLTFVPKLAAIALVFVFAGHWMLGQYIAYVHSLFGQVNNLLGS